MDEPAAAVVVVGASAGGVEALTTLAAALPEDLAAAVCVVLHVAPDSRSRLAEILARAGPLPAEQAHGGEPLVPGRILVAPPGHHLVLRDEHATITRGPHENGLRPSIDVLFRSAATAYGPRVLAVVLSGARDDGVAGATAVRARGGCVFVQDPADALFPQLPAETVSRDHPDRVLPLAELPESIASAVRELARRSEPEENGREQMSLETAYATLDAVAMARDGVSDEPSPYSCPDCGGVLWEVDDEDLLRFRCRVGHAHTAESALAAPGEEFETALWTALRALQERAQLSERLARRMGSAGARQSSARFESQAREARQHAEAIRRVLAGVDADGG